MRGLGVSVREVRGAQLVRGHIPPGCRPGSGPGDLGERDLPHELRLESWRPPSAAQCHLLTTVDRAACTGVVLGQVSPVDLRRIRELLRDMLDIDEQ